MTIEEAGKQALPDGLNIIIGDSFEGVYCMRDHPALGDFTDHYPAVETPIWPYPALSDMMGLGELATWVDRIQNTPGILMTNRAFVLRHLWLNQRQGTQTIPTRVFNVSRGVDGFTVQVGDTFEDVGELDFLDHELKQCDRYMTETMGLAPVDDTPHE